MRKRRGLMTTASACMWLFYAASLTHGQMSPEEHASHHVSEAGGATPAAGATPASPPAPASGMAPAQAGAPPAGGMGAGMGDMMKNMGKPPPKEVYPSLMGIPEFSPEKRTAVSTQADERMKSGTALLDAGLDRLNRAVPAGDYAAMQEATGQMREGLAQFESGVAAHRALLEGKPPRGGALQWFRGEMSLAQPGAAAPAAATTSWFHIAVMALLVLFAASMVGMYFFKMRRAAALFGRIEAGKGAPPPGSAPELAGGKPSETEKPPSGSQAAAPPDKPSAEKPDAAIDKPAADKPAAPADKPAASSDKPAAADNKLDAAAEKLAAATEKLVTATEKLATASDKPVVPADKPAAGAPPTGKGSPPVVPDQKRPAATRFTCLAPTARAVFLAGTFNGWDAKATPMVKDAEGHWDVAVDLPPGRHEFKFVVDGALCCEPGCGEPHQGCPKCVPNESGSMNRFIEVTPI